MHRMNRSPLRRGGWAALAAALFGASLAGCYAEGDTVDRVQTNVVPKSLFEGEWWYGQTMVEVDTDEALVTAGGAFEGGMAFADLGVEPRSGFGPNPSSLTMPRIRWVIDEDFLIAYRAYELIVGGNDDARDEEFRGQPLAVFAIEDHLDIRREYNAFTGELTNVRVENTADRRWFEREFVRVDWSQNLITSFYDALNTGLWAFSLERAPVPFDIEPGADHDELPAHLRPQFVRVSEDPEYRFRDEWPTEDQDTVHYFSIVNNEMITPGQRCLFLGGPCATAVVSIRHAFLRVPPQHEYEAATQTHDEFDQFGTFRTYQRTFVRGGKDRETLNERCTVDADCGSGGTCDVDRNICIGGLTGSYGETDYLAFYRPRHATWKNALSDVACTADWQCDGRFADTPGLGNASRCDLAAQRCTNPPVSADGRYGDDGSCPECRQPRVVEYRLSKGFPTHLVQTSFQVVGEWNEVFMQGHRATFGRPAMSADGADGVKGTADDVRISCQSEDPTAYCWCGGGEDLGDGTCPYKYDVFQRPDDAAALGVIAPYDCWVAPPEGFDPPARPTTYADYPADKVYGFTFQGDECAFILKSNSCDVDPEAPCEELGDIRYQFFNYIDHAFTRFGGVAIPLVDPTTGEFVSANANVAGTSVENLVTTAVDYFPFLRGERDPEWYVEGENVRRYFDGLGRTERPEGVSFLGSSGVETGDPDRPERFDRLGAITAGIERSRARLEPLTKEGAEAELFQHRMRRLADTPIEDRFLAGLGQDFLFNMVDPDQGFEASQISDAAAVQELLKDEAIRDMVSPFRGGFLETLRAREENERFLHSINYDPVMVPEINSRYWQYYAEAFRGRPLEEASIRMQQKYLYGVMSHEVGHSVGLRHNFAASYDRDNYPDAYFHKYTANDFALQLPSLQDFDRPSNGGNGNNQPDEGETTRYQQALREVRNTRAELGFGNFMYGSVMDYHGDLGILGGIGRYDVGATLWNHFDRVEVYEECDQCSPTGQPWVSSSDPDIARMRLPHLASRSLVPYYRGGESCRVEAGGEVIGCPFAGGASADVPWFQRCIQNPRNDIRDSLAESAADYGTACEVGEENCICSSSTMDVNAWGIGDPLSYPQYVAPRQEWQARTGTRAIFQPVDYLFCTDDRLDDLSYCSLFDAGESFLETIDHWRRAWYERYPNSYYRRFRRTNFLGRGAMMPITDAAKIYQHFLFRYFYEVGFRADSGPLGLLDQFDASSAAMNFIAEIATLPDQGVYELDADADVWRRVGDDFRVDDGDPTTVTLGPGEGFPMWSAYQDGLEGFFRTERAGVFFDKFFALWALAIRDWGLSFTIDERFYLNFYDLFRYDVTALFGGIIREDPTLYAPRMRIGTDGSPVITPLPWARYGSFRACQDPDSPEGSFTVPCNPVPDDAPPAIEGSTNTLLRDWATVLSLAQFPVYYDPTFERQFLVAKFGSGRQFTLPETFKADGSPGCAYGETTLDPSHVTGCEDPDYVVFTPDSLRQSYVAVKVRSRELNRFGSQTADFEQIGYELLRGLVDLQETVRDQRAELATLTPGTPAWTSLNAALQENDQELRSRTSFLDYLIEVQDRFGVSAFFF